jgi:hypothetical protein
VLNLAEKFRRAGSLDAVVFLDGLSSQQAGRHSLPDVVVDMAMMSEGEARILWADVLGCPPCTFPQLQVYSDLYYRMGPFFWWLHRLLPVQNGRIASAAALHPKTLQWLAEALGTEPSLVAELPRKLELTAKRSGMDLDPEQLLVDALSDRGVLKAPELARVKATRSLIRDPIPRWLQLQRLATEEQLNVAFREICFLPRTAEWHDDEVRRLAPLLPPGFAEQTGCYCLEEFGAAVRLGLAQMPASDSIRRVYDRLAGCSLFFEALTHEQARRLRSLMEHETVGTP